MRANHRHLRTIREHTFDNSPTDPNSSLNCWSSRHGVLTLYSCLVVLFASSQSTLTELKVVFLLLLQRSWIQTYFCYCPQYGSLRSTSFTSTFHIGSMFCFFPASFMSSTYTWKNHPFSRCTKKTFPIGKPTPNRVLIGFSQIAFPIIVLPKDDHTDFAQEERLDLPYWTMIWAICVVVDESKCLDIPILQFSIICEHLPFSLGHKQILRPLLVLRNQAVWRWYPWLLQPSFVTQMNLALWTLRMSLNQKKKKNTMSPRSTPRPLNFWNLGSNSEFLRWQMSINDAKCTVLPCFIDHLFFVSDFRQLPCRYLFKFFLFCMHCFWYFHCWRHRNTFVHEIVMVQRVDSFPCNVVFMIFMLCSFQTLSRRFVGFDDACVFCLGSIRSATSFPVLSSPDLARQCCWHRNFQVSPRMFNSFFEFRICWINAVNSAQSSGVVKLRFFESPLLFCFSLRCFWHVFPHLWPQVIKPGCRLFLRQPPPGPWKPFWRFFVQCGESCGSGPRSWKVSVSVNIPMIVNAALKHHIQGRTCSSGKRKSKVIYTDKSLEFGKACEDLSWNHCTSTPHRSETNGIAGRAVRRIVEGTSAVLLQSGLGEKWWADSMECCCYLRNMSDGKTPCGPVIPFGLTAEYHLHSPQDLSRLLQFGKKVLRNIPRHCTFRPNPC